MMPSSHTVQVPSKTTQGVMYTVRVFAGRPIGCTCKSRRYRPRTTCSHMSAVYMGRIRKDPVSPGDRRVNKKRRIAATKEREANKRRKAFGLCVVEIQCYFRTVSLSGFYSRVNKTFRAFTREPQDANCAPSQSVTTS